MTGTRPGVDARGDTVPRLTIGMPAYNNARTIRRALESLLAQTFRSFQLIVSDDGSRDGTPDICDAVAASDPRVVVVRQPKNLNYGNFRYVLERADTPFFMFAAGDDWWHAEYAARMVAALSADSRAVCAVSRVAFVENGEVVAQSKGTAPLVRDSASNIREFLAFRHDNSRMYGVFRTEVARRAFPPDDFHMYDWAFSVGTLLEGVHLEVPEVLMWRDHTPWQRYAEYIRRDATGSLSRLFPALPFTRDLLRRLQVERSWAMYSSLFRINAEYHDFYMRRYHPRWAKVTVPVVRQLDRVVRWSQRSGVDRSAAAVSSAK